MTGVQKSEPSVARLAMHYGKYKALKDFEFGKRSLQNVELKVNAKLWLDIDELGIEY